MNDDYTGDAFCDDPVAAKLFREAVGEVRRYASERRKCNSMIEVRGLNDNARGTPVQPAVPGASPGGDQG